MRLFLLPIALIVLLGCSQRLGTGGLIGANEASGTPPELDCTVPSPLCPDTAEEDSDKESDKDSNENGDGSENTATSLGSGAPPTPVPMIDYYGGGRNQFKLNVRPTTIPTNKEVELTITISAILAMELKPKDNYGSYRTYDLWVGAQKANSTSKLPEVYKLMHASPLTHFPQSKKPKCDITRKIASYRCDLQITQMNKGDSFTVKLMVKANEDFVIGFAKNTKKEPLTIKVE